MQHLLSSPSFRLSSPVKHLDGIRKGNRPTGRYPSFVRPPYMAHTPTPPARQYHGGSIESSERKRGRSTAQGARHASWNRVELQTREFAIARRPVGSPREHIHDGAVGPSQWRLSTEMHLAAAAVPQDAACLRIGCDWRWSGNGDLPQADHYAGPGRTIWIHWLFS